MAIVALLALLTLTVSPVQAASMTVIDTTGTDESGAATSTTVNADGPTTVDSYGTVLQSSSNPDGSLSVAASSRCSRRYGYDASQDFIVFHADAQWDNGWVRTLTVVWTWETWDVAGGVEYVGYSFHRAGGGLIESGAQFPNTGFYGPSGWAYGGTQATFLFDDSTRSGLYAPRGSGRYLNLFVRFGRHQGQLPDRTCAWRLNLP
jgi:hypothetical protein